MGSNAISAVLDTTHDTTIESPRGSPGKALRGTRFEAATPFGPLRLAVLDREPARHAADAAIALDRCAALVDALEVWFDQPLEWRWVATPAPAVESLATAFYRLGASAHIESVIAFPWALVRAVPAPPAALAERLQWYEIPVALTVASLDIPAAELAEMEPGGAIVLPDSMRPDWRGSLRAIDEPPGLGAGISVLLTDPSAPQITRANSEATAPRDPDPYEVRLVARHAIPSDRLTGWTESKLAGFDDRASLWRRGTAGDPDRVLALGRLIPWGMGWALAIETLCGGPETIAA